VPQIGNETITDYMLERIQLRCTDVCTLDSLVLGTRQYDNPVWYGNKKMYCFSNWPCQWPA